MQAGMLCSEVSAARLSAAAIVEPANAYLMQRQSFGLRHYSAVGVTAADRPSRCFELPVTSVVPLDKF
jgi:hypothetical protein